MHRHHITDINITVIVSACQNVAIFTQQTSIKKQK